MSMLTDMLERYRIREGLSVPRAAYLIGLTPAEYRRILAGEPIVRFETWQRICDLYGWPQTFASPRR